MFTSLASGALAVALVVAPAAAAPAGGAASSVGRSIVSADSGPDFTPSPNGWRKWMVNVTSKVLGGATPKAWQAEQLANEMLYDHSWEQWEAQLGIDGIRVNDQGQWVGIKYTNRGEGTFEDVVINNLEQMAKQKSAVGSGPVRAPATPFKTLGKTVGGALSVVSAYDLAANLGAWGVDTVGGWMGIDFNGAVCAASSSSGDENFPGSNAVFRFMTGQNCDAWDKANTYTPNLDAGKAWSAATWNGGSVQYLGYTDVPLASGSGSNRVACYQYTPPASYTDTDGQSVGLGWLHTSGSWTSLSLPWYSVPQSTNSSSIYQICVVKSGGNNGLVFSPSDQAAATSLALYFFKAGKPVGVPPVASQSDPDRTLQCEVTYTDGSSLTGPASAAYKESQAQLAQPTCPTTPDGKVPSDVQINQNTSGGSVPQQKVYDQRTTPEYQDWLTKYPECSMGACQLDLWDLQKQTSCFDETSGCPGWFDDANKASDYQCRYGVHPVDITECNVYAQLFTAGHVQAGAPWSDPTTGQWSGGQNAPQDAQTAFNGQIQDPDSTRNCDLGDMGFNPILWVMRPVQCAIEWAFVPRPAVVQADMAGAGDAWDGKAPAVIANAVQTMTLHPNVSGCSETVTIFSGVYRNTITPINACPGSWLAPIAAISKVIVDGIIVFLVITVIRRQIANYVGYRGSS